MTAAELLRDLRGRGFQIDAAGGRLLVSPASLLTDHQRGQIKLHVCALLALAEADREWREERAGILQFDAGFDRAAAEAIALELLRAVRDRARRAAA